MREFGIDRDLRAVTEIVSITMRERVAHGFSYNPGASQAIISSVQGCKSRRAILNRIAVAFRLQERERCLSYWGA